MTYFSKIFSKNNRHLVVGAIAGAAAISMQFLSHTVFLDKYKELVTLRRLSGEKVTPTKKIEERFQEVMNDLALSEEERKLLRTFTVNGYYTVHGGTFHKPYGGVVGIPENFHFDKVTQITNTDWIINYERITWVDDDALRLKATLIFSHEAQKFSIAREILKIQKDEPIIATIGLAVIVPIVLFIYHKVYTRFALHEKTRLFRIGTVGYFVVLTLILRAAVIDYFDYFNDKEIDKVLSKLGLQYINGGTECYQKLLDRNLVLRKKMGKRGERWYTIDGDEKYIYRFNKPSLTKKKAFFEKKFQSLYQTV